MTQTKRVAVVTGASSGIGYELAKILAQEGYQVGLIARRRENLEKLAGEIKMNNGICSLATADVGQREQVHKAFENIRSQLGPIDLLVANAGIGAPTLLEPINIDAIEK
ncbi:MAG TPA: SDR family NAD(P)-dependent oxidoreductase, partial [Gemmataceae bacterium]|nr:SDR family NAD(P)-dependent oxidoreductase [Gemmataceae bacterium]